ncbi:MAG: hypothetical protein ABIH26_13680, partial [Candidatus Eisenbacteria bacterium]
MSVVRSIGIAVLAIVLLFAAAYVSMVWVADRSFDRALARAGSAEIREFELGEVREGIAEVRIAAEGGEEVVGLCRVSPREESPEVRVLLVGGIGTGMDAVRLVGPIPGAEVYSFHYPLKERLPSGNALSRAASVPSIIKGIAESLVAFGLAERALQSREDGARTVLIGVSLGVPFVAALASTGERPD